MKQLEVQIMQQSYLLGCPEGGEARLLDAVARLDTAMTRIRDAGKIKARDRIAVLAALNLAVELADRDTAASATARQAAHVSPTDATQSPDARIAALLRRLDDALGTDGRLL